MDRSSCSLCGEHGCQSNTVPAGDVAVSLAVCGYEKAVQRLPRVEIADQDYTSGLCPECALGMGTLFPELISRY